jgi:tRNA-dihydrouridine synthase A
MPSLSHRFCAAPMMDLSDRHCRYFWRQITRQALLYTEMVTCGALIHGDTERFLWFDPAEHPLALQVGGSDPQQLAQCARMAQQWGFDEINLNAGCPSDRVQAGRFGACLMAEPELVRDCLAAMLDACDIPVTIKHRIGIDDMDSTEHLYRFVETVAESGCRTFIVHARKAWLKGLSPKQNREVPPLNYASVYQLAKDFEQLEIVINGGIESIEQSQAHLEHVAGVMLGRAAYQNPWCLAEVDAGLFQQTAPSRNAGEVIEKMLPYIESQLVAGARLNHITRHMVGLFQGMPGARRYRRYLSEHSTLPGAGPEVLRTAAAQVKVLAAA